MTKPIRPSEQESIGRYRIIRQLGQGGMGRVYLAHDPELDRNVALKVPTFSDDEDRTTLSRFIREARSVARLRHPNLCPVYDVGEDGDTWYFAMSYIDGPPLSVFTEPGNLLPPRRAVGAILKVARGVEAAHRQGVIHRDLKPSNIMIDREHREPVVMDFGLARSTTGGEESQNTHPGKILGTPSYMSPEQVVDDLDQLGPGTDIYSLGVVLYELLTGRVPFEGSVWHVLVQIQSQTPEPPSAFRHELDAQLDAICLRAMAKRAVDRYDTMQEFGNALARWLKETRDESPPSDSRRPDIGSRSSADQESQPVAVELWTKPLYAPIPNPGSEQLADLGFDGDLQSEIEQLVSQGSGVILASGPPASGTTTTACAIARSIDSYQHTMYSMAEPGVLELPGIESYQPEPDDSLARALHRCAHLFEPDIIFLDPIRDADSARAVFECDDEIILISEFAADDPADCILKLIEWTGQADLVANRLLGVCGQQLIRRLCPDCREAFRPSPAILAKVGLPDSINRLYRVPRSAAANADATRGKDAGRAAAAVTPTARVCTNWFECPGQCGAW